ncbi:unnamed protein product [Rhizoctonia solani]|uniref:DUF7587 domain-containing protein n=1 Tax=Rhizoctonia solani TaxID=456999 RepID=A0A8H3CX05_9AGAM|nr:unnamed protein product [Rhizoctonia solani]
MTTNRSFVSDRRDYTTKQFDRLMEETRFLFRCYSYNRFPTGKSPLKKDDGFVASKYSNQKKGIDVATLWAKEPARYTSAVDHVDANRPKNSPWISTTRSWDWAIWWMALNKNPLSTHKLKIAVIDLTLLPPPVPDTILAKNSRPHQGIVLHALDLISRANKEEKIPGDKLERVKNYANSADEVLVYAKIPLSAIVSRVTLDGLKLSIKAYIEPSTSEHWIRRLYDWVVGPPDDLSKKKNFSIARGQWVRKFRELGMNELQWGEECAGFAFLLLGKQIIEIDKMLRKLEARNPSRSRDAATGIPIQTNKSKEEDNGEAEDEETDEEDRDNTQLANVHAANFNKALEGPGLNMFKDAGASVEYNNETPKQCFYGSPEREYKRTPRAFSTSMDQSINVTKARRFMAGATCS